MKKTLMAVAGVAMAVVLTGCGGSPKGVAVDFANAIITKDPDKAIKCYDTTKMSAADIKKEKEEFDKIGKEINDDKLEGVAINELIRVPGEKSGYKTVNGKKYTGDAAQVLVQFVKGKDKKPDGMKVELEKVDGSWLVTGYRQTKDLDTSDK